MTASALAVGGTIAACGAESFSAARAAEYCEFYQECEEDYFDEEFDSLAECKRELTDDIDDALDEARDVSKACERALHEYIDCTFGLYDKRTCDDGDYEDCYDAYEELYDECGDDARMARQPHARRIARAAQ